MRINCPKMLNLKIKQEKIDEYEAKLEADFEAKRAREKTFEADSEEIDMINFVTSGSFEELLGEKNPKQNEICPPRKKRKHSI